MSVDPWGIPYSLVCLFPVPRDFGSPLYVPCHLLLKSVSRCPLVVGWLLICVTTLDRSILSSLSNSIPSSTNVYYIHTIIEYNDYNIIHTCNLTRYFSQPLNFLSKTFTILFEAFNFLTGTGWRKLRYWVLWSRISPSILLLWWQKNTSLGICKYSLRFFLTLLTHIV